MKSPEKTTRIFLSLVLLSSVFLDFWEYSRAYYKDPDVYLDVVRGTAGAPNQYRIGVIRLAATISRHAGLGLRHAMTLLDLVSAGVALFLLYELLRRSRTYARATVPERWLASAAFVVLVQFYLAWITWYQRPETLPTALTVALSLALLAWRPPFSPAVSLLLLGSGTVLVVFCQSLVRADVAFTLHVGVLLLCLTPAGAGVSLPRFQQAALSLLAVLLAGATQFYLMHVAFPHASYGDTPVFQLKLNVTDRLRIVPFALFLFPWGWTVWKVVRRSAATDAPYRALLAGSAVFLPLWCVLGKIDEVRIFLPFALALAPLTALLLARDAAARDEAGTGRYS